MVESIGFGADGFFVIPGHPLIRIAEYFSRMLLECFEIFKWIDFAKITGMDQAHEQIADVRPMFGFIKQ